MSLLITTIAFKKRGTFLPFFRKGKKDPVYPVILSGRDKMACQEAAEGD